MALRKASQVDRYDFSGGVNIVDPGYLIAENQLYADPNAFSGTLNTYWRRGLKRRGGTLKAHTTAKGSKVNNAIRHYRSAAPAKTTIAAIDVTSETDLLYLNSSDIWSDIAGGSEISTGKDVEMAAWLDNVYCASGERLVQVLSYSAGWARANITGLTVHPAGITVHRDRLWVWGGDMVEGQIRSCEYGDATSWPTEDIFNVGYKDGGPVRNALSLGDDLWVYKHGTIWVIRGDNLENWFQNQGEKQVGCAAGRTVVDVGHAHMFVAPDDMVYYFDGASPPLPVGRDIRTWIADVPTTYKPKMAATYHDGFYKLAFTSASGTYNDRELWFDVIEFRAKGVKAWWPMKGRSIAAYCKYNGPGDGNLLYHGDSHTGFLRRDEIGTQDDGVSIRWEAHSRYETMDAPNRDKLYGRFKIDTTRGVGNLTLEVKRNLDESFILTRILASSAGGGLWSAATLGTTFWSSQANARQTFDLPMPSGLDGNAFAWHLVHESSEDNVMLFGASFDYRYKEF